MEVTAVANRDIFAMNVYTCGVCFDPSFVHHWMHKFAALIVGSRKAPRMLSDKISENRNYLPGSPTI